MSVAGTQPPSPLVRRRSGRLVAGVAGGVADHLGADVRWVRAAFVVLAVLGWSGVVAYALLWIFVRQEQGDVVRTVDRSERQQAIGLAALGLGLGLVGAATGNVLFGWLLGPLGVVAIGAAVVWREADGAQRRRWTIGVRGGGRAGLARTVIGALLVAVGLAVYLVGNLDLDQVRFGLLAAFAALLGVAVLTVPWWVRLVRDLTEERRARIVTAERAEIAAHLHDSVLQTLALIQRQAGSPREVNRLARGQERELRAWLYGPGGYGRPGHDGDDRPADEQLSVALGTAAGEVEDTYAVTVNPVVVGDATMDPDLRALVLAAREAMVNAAKHAGVEDIDVYAEVDRDGSDRVVDVFVRDRGAGFDPDAVGPDRHGLADSIRNRMERHGGTVRLKYRAGRGHGDPADHAVGRRRVGRRGGRRGDSGG